MDPAATMYELQHWSRHKLFQRTSTTVRTFHDIVQGLETKPEVVHVEERNGMLLEYDAIIPSMADRCFFDIEAKYGETLHRLLCRFFVARYRK